MFNRQLKKIIEHNPLLVRMFPFQTGVASATPQMDLVREIFKFLKEGTLYIKTIAGGIHPLALQEKTHKEEYVDSENTLPMPTKYLTSTVEHIKEILKHKIQKKILQEKKYDH